MRGRGCVQRLCHRPVSRALATGVTFNNRTTSAPWAAREAHSTVIDAAGAIYVIGGGHDSDVWVSTDGGARPDSRGGVLGRVLKGCSGGTQGYLLVLEGTEGGKVGCLGVSYGHLGCTRGY